MQMGFMLQNLASQMIFSTRQIQELNLIFRVKVD